jgi:hypothetical protein
MMSELAIILHAELETGSSLLVKFADGSVRRLDLHAHAMRGGVFSRLADPGYAAAFEIAEGGRVLRWPGELDFCADAMLLKGEIVEPVRT